MAVDVIVIGSGPGGAWVARDLAESGLKVKVFEAGPRHNPDTDFKEDVIEMWGFFGWKGQRVTAGQGVGGMSTGVGGSTLDYWGMSPQPQNFAIDEWPSVLRDDMFGTAVDPFTGYYVPIKFYDWIDNRVPIDKRQDRPISCGAQLCIKAASELGYTAGRCPAAMLPPKYERVDEKGYPLEGCVGCAHCTIGCRRPRNMPLHAKAKRTMQVAAIAFAEMYDCEVIPNAHVTRITTDGSGAANGVEYKIKGDPATYSETAHVVFLGGGAIESPRLYLNSGLPEPNPGYPSGGALAHGPSAVGSGVLFRPTRKRCPIPGTSWVPSSPTLPRRTSMTGSSRRSAAGSRWWGSMWPWPTHRRIRTICHSPIRPARSSGDRS